MLNPSESVLYFFHLWCFADKHVARIAFQGFRRLNEVCSWQTFWSLRRCGRLIVLSVSFVPSAKTAAQSGAGFFKLSYFWTGLLRWSSISSECRCTQSKTLFCIAQIVRMRASQPCFTPLLAFTLIITLKYGNCLTLFVFCRSTELNHLSFFSEMPLTSKLAGKK